MSDELSEAARAEMRALVQRARIELRQMFDDLRAETAEQVATTHERVRVDVTELVRASMLVELRAGLREVHESARELLTFRGRSLSDATSDLSDAVTSLAETMSKTSELVAGLVARAEESSDIAALAMSTTRYNEEQIAKIAADVATFSAALDRLLGPDEDDDT